MVALLTGSVFVYATKFLANKQKVINRFFHSALVIYYMQHIVPKSTSNSKGAGKRNRARVQAEVQEAGEVGCRLLEYQPYSLTTHQYRMNKRYALRLLRYGTPSSCVTNLTNLIPHSLSGFKTDPGYSQST